MAYSPAQARKVFFYATLFSLLITGCMILISLFVFIDQPSLNGSYVWYYIMETIPTFAKILVSISLVTMALARAASILNTCAVIFCHDIIGVIQSTKENLDLYQLRWAKVIILVVGLSGIALVFYYHDLLSSIYWMLSFCFGMLLAPFILAVLGFRSTFATVLVGMVAGFFTILYWNVCVEPSTNIDGTFIAVLVNGLTMVAFHYLMEDPEDGGWVKLNNP